MKKKLKKIGFFTSNSLNINSIKILLFFTLLLTTSVLGQVESFNLSMMNDGDLQNMLSKISSHEKFDDYDGSPYLFENEKEGNIFIGDVENVFIDAKFNLNFLSMEFVIYEEKNTYSLNSNQVKSFVVGDFTYIRNDDNEFIKIIFKDDNFSLIEKYRLEIKDQPYVVGYEKPTNNLLSLKKSVLIYSDGNLIPFKPKLKFLQSLFNSNTKDLKKFIKENSLKLRDHQDLKLIFKEFKTN
jgi:hypothetical protein